MMQSEIRVQVASVPDRTELVAELWHGDAMWGELRGQASALILELYPNPSGGSWSFALEHVMDALGRAQQQLLNG